MIRKPTSYVLIAWVAVGGIRVLLGSSTAPVAYVFFGLFYLVSLLLLIAAVRQFLVSKKMEEKSESICICVVLTSSFSLGLLGPGGIIPVAALAFSASVIALLFIYGRRLWRKYVTHP